MSAAAMIASLGGISVTVTRQSVAGTYVNRKYVKGATGPLTVTMAIVPLTGEQLLKLPEGDRTKNWAVGYCATQLFTAEQSAVNKADLLNDGLATYEVQNVKAWRSPGATIEPFWEVMMVEVNP